ncbi:MAG TPA: hypothetical protein VIG66_04565 [Noviherbaspirillum sp.]
MPTALPKTAACSISVWCELREDFRTFRLDRTRKLTTLDAYPRADSP